MASHVNLLSTETSEYSPSDFSGPNLSFEIHQDKTCVRRAKSWKDMVATAENDDIELVLWKRSRLSPLVVTQDVPACDIQVLVGGHEDILAGFTETFAAADWPISLHHIVQQDVQAFLESFEDKLPASQYRLRLQSLSDDGCRRFHQDCVFQRLIITYRGDGTVWRFMDDPAQQCAVEQNAIDMECVLLRGKRAGRETNILHKSPIFKNGSLSRLIMVIDSIPSDDGPTANNG